LNLSPQFDEVADADTAAALILERVGNNLVLGLPLGLGKANHLVNTLTRRALADPGINLQIITALTLTQPRLDNEFKRRLLGPAMSRLFGDYPPLDYAGMLRDGRLPANIQVSEFFLQAGQWLDVDAAQRHYIPANYTHALGYLLERGVNVVLQLVAEDPDSGDFSLGSNPDITVDLLRLRAEGRCRFLLAGQYSSRMPFMEGPARFPADRLDILLRSPEADFPLFTVPRQPVSLADYAIGLHTARLVRDGGTLQIGIGSIGDAVTRALLLRHEQPDEFARCHDRLNRPSTTGLEETGPFREGLYGVSEMFVDGFLHLAEHGILSRQVDGAVLHSGFFLDCEDFYRRLRALTPGQRQQFPMMPVSFTNEIYGDRFASEGDKRAARVRATFINSAMMVTLRGAVVADALEDGRVVSGVGGQYNFAAQAFALDDARFVITLNATRQHRGRTRSNIVWSYGHATLPWHLRDIVVTEYGVADLRGRTENEAIKALLAVCDSRFQPALLKQAVASGKIEADWQLPPACRDNLPSCIQSALGPLQDDGTLKTFPFGSAFTATEQRLLPALDHLRQHAHSRRAMAALAWQGLSGGPLTDDEEDCMVRMAGESGEGPLGRLQRLVLKAALLRTR